MMMTTMQKKMKLLHGRSEQPCGREHDKNNFHWSTKKYIQFNWSSKYEKITGSVQFRASIGLQSTALVAVHLRKPNKHVYQ